MPGYGVGWMWSMGLMMTGSLLLTLLLVGLVVWLVITYARPAGTADDTRTARLILAERYARGELDTEEYRQRLNALQR